MKVPAITAYNNHRKSYIVKSDTQDGFDIKREIRTINDLSGIPYYYPVSFTSYSGSAGLRSLLQYGIPCMYTGIPMVDPASVSKHIKNGDFSKPSGEVIKTFKKYEPSLVDSEKEIYKIIKDRANAQPDKTISELVKDISFVYRKKLRKVQMPIFQDLITMSGELPPREKALFDALMSRTFKRLEEKEDDIRFSPTEFKYRLAKIREDILVVSNNKTKKTMNKIFKESKKLPSAHTEEAKKEQMKIIKEIQRMTKNTQLEKDPALIALLENSKQRLENKKVIEYFSRKSFLYDLSKILDCADNQDLKARMMMRATELPTSTSSISAYIMKISNESSDKICFRLLWPSVASIEHILPRSEGGENVLENYGLACTRINSQRKSQDLKTWLEQHPEAKENCQKYVDRLIELHAQGKFPSNLSPRYILDFANTIYEVSEHTLKLDTSKLTSATS